MSIAPGTPSRAVTLVRILGGRRLAILAAILSAACWGSATVMSKAAVAQMPPMTLLAIQLTASITVLWLAVLVSRLRIRLERPDFRASLSGLLEPGLSYTFGVVGLALTTASNSALVGAAEPLFILLLAWPLLKERVGPPTLAFAAMATLGIVLVMVPDTTGLAGQGAFIGDGLVLMGTFFAAIYVIAARRLMRSLDPLPLSALQQSVGLVWALGVLAAALVSGLATLGIDGLPPSILLLVAASGIVQYAFAFWLYLFALQSLPASVAGFYLTLIPVFGIAGASALLGEALTPMQGVGALFVIAAVSAMSRVRHA